jgi:hypothetical protein
MGSKTARAERQREREDNTAKLMENILTGGEISKAREAELQRAANFGRGVQLLPPSTTVEGLTQAGGQPVMLTNPNFQPRIVANQPTLAEAGGDIVRGLFGGQAERPIFTSPDAPPGRETDLDFANMVPAPERTEGIIPTILKTGGIGGIVLDAFRNLLRGQEEEEEQQPMPSAFTTNPAYFINPGDLTPKNIEVTELLGSPTTPPNQPGGLSLGQAAPGGIDPSEDTISSASEVPANIGGFAVQGAPVDFITTNRAFFYPEDYTLPFTNTQIPSLGRFLETIFTGGQGAEATERLTPAGEALYNDLIDQGLNRDEAISRIRLLEGTSFAMGGSVPPEKGPMSQGVGSLFQER